MRFELFTHSGHKYLARSSLNSATNIVTMGYTDVAGLTMPLGRLGRSPARLLVVIGGLDRGGTEGHLLNVLPRLNKGLVRPEVFTLGRRGELADEMERRGVQVVGPWISASPKQRSILWRATRLGLATSQLFFRCLVRRPEIIHFFLPASYILGGPIAVIARIHYRIMSRRSMNHYHAEAPGRARIEKWLHQRMTLLIGNSRRVVEQLIEEGADPQRVALIYNGADTPVGDQIALRRSIRKRLEIDDETVVLIIVANLIPYKGHNDLLDALNLARGRLPFRWQLLVVGRDDGIGDQLLAKAASYGIPSNVRFLGSREDVPSLVAGSDIGVLCSHEEGFSNAILEYMQAGLPVVATDVGGNAEAIIHGKSGFIVPASAPGALAEALVRFCENPELRRAMGIEAKQRCGRYFSSERCVDEYNALYGSILDNQIQASHPSAPQDMG